MSKAQEPKLKQPWITRKDLILVCIVMSSGFFAVLNQTVLSPALPKLMETFRVSASQIQWLTTIYMLVNGIMIPISAFMIDRFSTKRLFILSMFIFFAGTALAAVSPSFSALLMSRVLQAIGTGIQVPMTTVVSMLLFPREKRGTALGIVGIVIGCAPAVGPALAGWIIDSFGWRMVFASILPLLLIVIVLAFLFVRDIGERKSTKLDVLSVVLSTLGFGGVLYGFSAAGDQGWTNIMTLGPILVGIACLVWFVRRQLHLAEPLLELRTLKVREFSCSTIINMAINGALAVGTILMPIYLQNVLGCSALVTGTLMMPGAIIMMIMSPISGVLFDRFGPRGMAITGMICLTVGTAMFLFLGTATPLLYIVIIYTLQTVGMALVNMPVNTWGLNALENQYISHGNAINNTGRQVASSICTALIVTVMSTVTASHVAEGSALATVSGVRAAYVAALAIAIFALVITLVRVRDTSKNKLEEMTE